MTPPGEPELSAPMDGRVGVELSVWSVLRAVTAYVRRQPRCLGPFGVAGLVVALADWIRTTDPIPMTVPHSLQETVSVQYAIVPMGTHRTVRTVDALVDLRVPYFLGAVGLELLVFVAVAGAGYLTLRRVLQLERDRNSAIRYGLAVTALGFVPQWLGTPNVTLANLLVGLVLVVLFSVIAVRLFLFPGLVVAGASFRTALGQSRSRSRGIGWTLLGLAVVFGIASWGLALVPVVGGLLSTAVVPPVHAISLGVLVRHTGRHRPG